jgi:hypothetical protein
MPDPSRDFDNLRKWRTPKSIDFGIGADVSRLCSEVRSESEAAANASVTLATILPETLRDHVRVQEFARGVLTLKSTHAAHRYSLEQWLRSGGLAVIRGALKTSVSKVKCL